MTPVDMDLLMALASHARHRAHHLALAYGTERLSYAQLAERVARLFAAFTRHGCQPGDRVGVACYQGTLPAELYLAAQAADLVPVLLPITLGVAMPQLAAGLRVKHLFVGDDLSPEHLHPDVRVWQVARDPATAGGFVQTADAPDPAWVHRRPPDQLSGIQFSAGTTGTPKAVLRTVRADVWDAWNKQLAYGTREGDIHLCIVPRNLGVLVGALRGTLLVGGAVMSTRDFDAAQTLAALRSEDGVFILPLQTPHWRALLAHPGLAHVPPGRVRTAIAVGQRLPTGMAREIETAFGGARVVISYGTTETSMLAALTSDNPAFGVAACVGRPLPTVDVQVVDPDGRPVGEGVRGVVRVMGPSVVPGYDASVDRPSNPFADGWFDTGDVGYWDHDHNLYVVDRWADVFEVDGQQVFPGEIQERLFQLASVQDVAVSLVDGPRRPTPTVFVVPRRADFDPLALRGPIADVSPVAFEIVTVDHLPKILGAKLDRAALRRGSWPALSLAATT